MPSDTVSRYLRWHGEGKKKALKMVMEKQDVRAKLEGIGKAVPGGEGIANIEHFV